MKFLFRYFVLAPCTFFGGVAIGLAWFGTGLIGSVVLAFLAVCLMLHITS